MKKLRIGITGAGGQIGSHLLRLLPETPGITTVGVCRNEVTAGPLRVQGFDVRVGELTAQANELLADCDVIINCASASALPGQARREDRSTLEALFATTGHAPIVHFSSVAVYGTCIDHRVSSFDRPNTDYGYARDKFHLETYARRLAKRAARRLTVLRLGHVYGVEQWVSRYALTWAQVPGWGLPFDGGLPSNAVHVRNVVAALRHVVTSGVWGATYNLFDWPQSTWRDVFDWNTEACALPRAASLEPAMSERALAQYRSMAATPLARRIARELVAWGRGVPASVLAASPSLKNFGLGVLALTRSPSLEQRVMKFMSGTRVFAAQPPIPVKDPWLLSDAAPGPALQYLPERAAADAQAVGRWFRGYSDPDSVLLDEVQSDTTSTRGAA